jgi:hypothetical protein
MEGSGCTTANDSTALYRRRRPERTLLYRTVQTNLATWLALADEGDPVPAYVEQTFRRYLECAVLAQGFARARCGECGHDFLIAFSCKGRGICPSCNTRRMVATAAHLTDHVLPDLPVRQWVLAVPKRLRYFLERDADLQGAALRLFLRRVEQCLRAHSPGSGPAARLGAVAFIHRFGSSLNAHLHFHGVVIDGVFDATATGGVVFHAATGLEANAIAQVQAQVRRRLARACSCAAACCQPMTRRRWGDGNMAAASPSTPRCASRPPTAPGASGCCGTAPGHRSPSTGCASATASTSSTTPRNRAPVQVARSA